MRVKHPVRLLVLTLGLMTTCFAQVLFDDSHRITQSFKENSLWKGIDPVKLFNTMSMNRMNAKRMFAQKVLPVVSLNIANALKDVVPSRIIVSYEPAQQLVKAPEEVPALKFVEDSNNQVKNLA